MTDFSKLYDQTTDSLIINEDKTILVFRAGEVLFFYQALEGFTSVKGLDVFDSKYGQGFLTVNSLILSDAGDETQVTLSDPTLDLHIFYKGPLEFLGSIKESVLTGLNKFNQLVEDFTVQEEVLGRTSCAPCNGSGCDRCISEGF